MTGRPSGKPPLKRLRWSIPPTDTATLEWLGAQDNVSVSLQMVIHEVIERDGYVDVLNKSVDELGPPVPSGGETRQRAETGSADLGDRPVVDATPSSTNDATGDRCESGAARLARQARVYMADDGTRPVRSGDARG